MGIPWPDPILAAAGWISVVFLVVMLLGAIMNFINKQNKQAPARGRRRQPPRRGGDDQLQSEIDSFLQEVGGGRPRERVDEVAIEIVPDEERSLRRRQRPRPQSRPAQQPSAPVEPEQLSERHLTSSIRTRTIGRGLREHVAEYMADDHIDERVEQDMDHSVGSDWATHGEHVATGAGDVEFAPPPAGGTSPYGAAPVTTHEIVNLLRNPATIRQAILVSEILSRPKSQR
jgi:hypothetical protein